MPRKKRWYSKSVNEKYLRRELSKVFNIAPSSFVTPNPNQSISQFLPPHSTLYSVVVLYIPLPINTKVNNKLKDSTQTDLYAAECANVSSKSTFSWVLFVFVFLMVRFLVRTFSPKTERNTVMGLLQTTCTRCYVKDCNATNWQKSDDQVERGVRACALARMPRKRKWSYSFENQRRIKGQNENLA